MSDLSTTKAGWRVVNTACSDAVKWKVITSQYHGGWKASQLMTAGGSAYASVCGVQEKTVDASSWYDLCGWLGAEYLTSQVSLAVDVSTSSGSGMFFAGFVEECNSDEWSSMMVDAYKHTGSGLVQEMVLSLDRSIQVFASVEKVQHRHHTLSVMKTGATSPVIWTSPSHLLMWGRLFFVVVFLKSPSLRSDARNPDLYACESHFIMALRFY